MSEHEAPGGPAPGRPRRGPSALRSVALGVAGFVLFWLSASSFLSAYATSGEVATLLLGIVALVDLLAFVRRTPRAERAWLAPLAVGFAAAAVVVGGCIALIANGSIRVAG